jgi:hypothetical protein
MASSWRTLQRSSLLDLPWSEKSGRLTMALSPIFSFFSRKRRYTGKKASHDGTAGVHLREQRTTQVQTGPGLHMSFIAETYRHEWR